MNTSLRIAPALLITLGLLLGGCDQSSQNVTPDTGDSYVITQAQSASGDASTGSLQGSSSVTAPDTVDYYVQGFTVNKDYTWTVNGENPPTEVSAEQTYLWERRNGEFITVVYGSADPITGEEVPGSVSVAVDASGDDIQSETIEVSVEQTTVGGQVARFGAFSTLANLASSSGIADILSGTNSDYTLFAPSNSAFAAGSPPAGALGGAVPTQATDDGEAPTSSVRADILKYHAVASNITASDLPAQNVPTLLGDTEIDELTADMVSQANIRSSNGTVHKINAPLLPPTASVDFTDRTVEAEDVEQDSTITVDGLYVPEGGGFVVLHDQEDLQNLGAIPSVVGVSDYIEGPGVVNEVEVTLDEDITGDPTLVAMPHQDTNDNETYDFASSGGTEDGPYTLNGSAVTDPADFTIE